MRRFLSTNLRAGLALILLALLMAACGEVATETPPSPTPATIRGEITVWSWGANLKGLQANLAGFNRLYPGLKISLTEMRPPEIYEKLDAGLMAGGVGLPDVVQIETERLDFFTTKFREGFADLRSWASKYDGQFDPLKWSTVQRVGRTRALPWDSSPAGLFYRADLFRQAGIDLAKIETWNDFIEAGQRLQATKPDMKLLAFNPNDDALLRVLMSLQGASYFTLDNKINLSSPEAARALTLIKRLYSEGLLLSVTGENEALAAVQANRVASYVAGPSWITLLQNNAPEMSGKWEVLALPAVTAGGGRSANLGGSMLAQMRTGKNQDAAAAFIEYCLANKENQNLMLTQAGLLPSFLPAHEDSFYFSRQPYFNNKPVWQFFAREVRQLKIAYYTKDFELASDAATTAQLMSLIKVEPALALQKKVGDLKDATSREAVK